MKYRKQFFKPKEINTKDNIFVGYIWGVEGSKGKSYDVVMHNDGFECSCPGFGFRSQCKHINGIVERLVSDEYPRYNFFLK